MGSRSLILTLGLTLSSCAFSEPPRPISYYVHDVDKQKSQTEAENSLLEQFYIAGGGVDASKKEDIANYDEADWWIVVNGARSRIDKECNQYLANLNRIDNERKTDLQAISIGSPAITTISSTAGAGRDALAYIGAALGIVAAAPNLAADHFLYGVSPTSLSRMVGSARSAAWAELQKVYVGDNLKTRPDAVAAIESYLRICMPENIRSLADQALENAKFQPITQQNPQESGQRDTLQQRKQLDNITSSSPTFTLQSTPPSQ